MSLQVRFRPSAPEPPPSFAECLKTPGIYRSVTGPAIGGYLVVLPNGQAMWSWSSGLTVRENPLDFTLAKDLTFVRFDGKLEISFDDD